MSRPLLLCLVALLGATPAAPAAHAQRPARIEGLITDSVHSRPLVGAIEIYSDAAGASVQHDRRCGLVIIWTKR